MNILKQLDEKEEQIRYILIQPDKITFQQIVKEFTKISKHTRFILDSIGNRLGYSKISINKNYVYELIYCREKLNRLQKIDDTDILNIQQVIDCIDSLLQSFTDKELSYILASRSLDIKRINKSRFHKIDPFRNMKYKKDMFNSPEKRILHSNLYSLGVYKTQYGYVNTNDKLELAIALACNMEVTFSNILFTTIDYKYTPKLLKCIIDYSEVIQKAPVLYRDEYKGYNNELYIVYKQEITAIEFIRILTKSEILFELVEKYMSKDIVKEILNK